MTVTDDNGATGQDTVVITVSDASSDLIGYWKFDEGEGTTAVDSSGNGNDGSIIEAAWTTGTLGGALSFDGADDRVVPPSPDPGVFHDAFAERTVSAWVTIDSTSATPNIIYEEGAGTGIVLGYRAVSDTVVFRTSIAATAVEIASSSTFPEGTGWIHVAAVYDNGTMCLYINGTEEATDFNGTSIPAHGSEPGIGGRQDFSSFSEGGSEDSVSWQGKIDEVRIYNRALSPEEIAQLAGN